jgi:hypothetical protein
MMKRLLIITVGFLEIAISSSAQLDSIGNSSVKVTNPPSYPYGVDIDVNFTGNWNREFGVSYGGTGKFIGLGASGSGSTFNYGYIGGNTSSATALSNPWMSFLSNGNIGIGTLTPSTLLEVKSGIDLGQTGTQYISPFVIGTTNDYGGGGAAQYILLIPQYNGTVGEASAGMSGRFAITRGSFNTFNQIQEYDVSAQTAYSSSNINLVPKSNQSYPLNVYSVTYNGTPYLALNGADLINAGGFCTFTGYYWNNVNTVKPQIVLASACTNVSEFQSYTYLSGSIYSANASGYIGIGTSNPQSMLAVEGTITAQAVAVSQTGWSDFVFDSTYRRMPLNQVAAYTTLHKHLPEVPSAAEIGAKGLDLGEMEKIHMQKIEELTLYAIDADKRITQLQALLENQQKEIDLLKAQLQH